MIRKRLSTVFILGILATALLGRAAISIAASGGLSEKIKATVSDRVVSTDAKKGQSAGRGFDKNKGGRFPGNPYSPQYNREMRELLEETAHYREEMLKHRSDLRAARSSAQDLEDTITGRLSDMESLAEQIRVSLKQEDIVRDKKIKNMAATFTAMKPSKAAAVLAKLPNRLAVPVLSVVTPEVRAKIISALPQDRGVELSRLMMVRMSDVR